MSQEQSQYILSYLSDSTLRLIDFEELDSAGNAYKVRKLVSATDSDNSATIDALIKHPNCNGRIGTTGMCYGGHLAFRVRLLSLPLQALLQWLMYCRLQRTGSSRSSSESCSLLLPDRYSLCHSRTRGR